MKKFASLICCSLAMTTIYSQTLTYGQIYDYEVGDFFQSRLTKIYHTDTTYYSDKVITKSFSQTNDTVFYTINRHTYVTPKDTNSSALITDIVTDTFYTNLNITYVFNTSWNSLSCLAPSYSFYLGNGTSAWEYSSNQNNYCIGPTIWAESVLEGAGGPYKKYWSGGGGMPPNWWRLELVYWKKGSKLWGSFFQEPKIPEPQVDRIYPNPGQDYIYLPNNLINCNVSIYNSVGQLVKTLTNFNGKIDIVDLEIGFYILRASYLTAKFCKR